MRYCETHLRLGLGFGLTVLDWLWLLGLSHVRGRKGLQNLQSFAQWNKVGRSCEVASYSSSVFVSGRTDDKLGDNMLTTVGCQVLLHRERRGLHPVGLVVMADQNFQGRLCRTLCHDFVSRTWFGCTPPEAPSNIIGRVSNFSFVDCKAVWWFSFLCGISGSTLPRSSLCDAMRSSRVTTCGFWMVLFLGVWRTLAAEGELLEWRSLAGFLLFVPWSC